MSWLFSRVLVEEYSQASSLDGAQSALWSETPTPQASWSRAKTMGACLLSRSGMTSARLMGDHGKAALTSYLEAFPARTSPAQAREQGSTEPDQASGPKWRESFARWDPDSSSWKTRPSSLGGGSTVYSGTWPRWGMMRDGGCWARATQAPPTGEIESGSWPTPREQSSRRKCISRTPRNKCNLEEVVGERAPGAPLGYLNPPWVEWLMGWPIGWTALEPLATDKSPPAPPSPGEPSRLWPTPTTTDGSDGISMNDPERWRKRHAQKAAQGINLQYPLRIAVQDDPFP